MSRASRLAATAHLAPVLAWGGIAVLAYSVYRILEPFLIPIGWATVLAVMCYPLHARLVTRWGAGRAAGLTVTGAALVILVPGVALTAAFAREMLDLAAHLQTSLSTPAASHWQVSWGRLAASVPFVQADDLASAVADALRSAAGALVSQAGAVVQNIAVFFADLVLALFTAFFLLRDADAIMRTVRRLIPMAPAAREDALSRTRDLIDAGVRSAVIVAGLQGLLGGAAFAVLGISAPVFWGVVMALCCLLPFGAWVIWLPAAVVLVTDGAVTRGAALAIFGVAVVSTADNIVRPYLLSGRVHMNGLVILLSLLGGLHVFGLLGIVLGPIVIVSALAFVDAYTSRPDAEHD